MTDRNVVTLLPSATEIVYALGAEPVAVSHECDYPPPAQQKPRANSCVIDPNASSAEINDQLDANDQIYEIKQDVLREVNADLIITQGICDVCAVDQILVHDVLNEMDLDTDILTTDPHSIDDILADIRRIGNAIGHSKEAESLIDDLRSRINTIQHLGSDVDNIDSRRCLVLDWMEPPMVAGHWIPEMIEMVGGTYGITEHGSASRPIEFDEIVAFDPETLIIAPCGYEIDHTKRDIDELRQREGWNQLTAVQEKEVYIMDGEIINCPSPRLIDSLETFGHLLHPDVFEKPTQPFEALQFLEAA
ncbi:MAG: cobalamin-binding protein [Halobacteriaceae archaeon]